VPEMSVSCVTIEQRIESCRSLLDLFHKEREVLLSKDHVEAKDVLPMLKLKKQLLEKFESASETLKNGAENPDENRNDESEENRRELLRQLSDLLEQLLVIDRENQRLLREVLSATQNVNAQEKVQSG